MRQETSLTRTAKVLALSATVESVTGLALIAAPALVARLLLGEALAGVGVVVARCFGVALLALSLSVWPRAEVHTAQAARGMLLYNALLAIYLAWLGTGGQMSGLLLWPAAALHGIVAALLARWFGDRGVAGEALPLSHERVH